MNSEKQDTRQDISLCKTIVSMIPLSGNSDKVTTSRYKAWCFCLSHENAIVLIDSTVAMRLTLKVSRQQRHSRCDETKQNRRASLEQQSRRRNPSILFLIPETKHVVKHPPNFAQIDLECIYSIAFAIHCVSSCIPTDPQTNVLVRRAHQLTSSNVSTRFRSLSCQHLGYACVREQREEKQGNMKTSCCTVTSKTRGEEKQHRQKRNEREHVECVSVQRNEKDKSPTDERRRVNQRVRFDC